MKINWKVVAQSKGYKSLKATMIQDIQDAARLIQRGHKPMRSKEYFHKHFNWIINRAKSYAVFYRQSLEFILNDWENKRTYCWLNYYQESRQPKPNLSGLVKPKSPIKYYKTDKWYANDSVARKKRIFTHILRLQKENSKRKGKKARWTKEQKTHYKKYGFK